MKLTNYLCPGPRLRISGAIPLLPKWVFMAWYLVKEEMHLH